MDYIAIAKRAYQITVKNKFLWIFGIFAGTLGISYPTFNYNFTDAEVENLDLTQQGSEFLTVIKDFFIQNWLIIALIGIFLLLLLIFLIVFSFIAQGALIGGVNQIEHNKAVNFRSCFKIGWQHFWRLFVLGIITSIFVLIVMTLLIIISIALFILSPILAIIMGMVFLLLFWLLMILINLIVQFAQRYIIIDENSVLLSLENSLALFRRFWLKMLGVLLMTIIVGLLIGIIVLLILIIILVPLILLGVVVYTISTTALIIAIAIVSILLFLAIIIFSGGMNTYYSSIWTLSYLELLKIK